MAILIAALITTAVAILAATFGLLRWAARVDANTAATEKLTAAFEGFMPQVTDRLNDHEVRLTVLEKSSY